MEANICDVSHLDSDALLPPRKRLLAGLKKQNSNGNSNTPSPSSASAASEFDTRIDKILRSHLNDPNLSSEEIIKSSRLAAEAAVKVAEAARVTAEEKAAKAAKAVAAAKNALELLASVSEEAARREGSLKKNKMKRHVPVQMLYNKYEYMENCTTDEELARKLHQAMNSSPRISKNSSSSDLKGHKHKKLKSLSSSARSRAQNGGIGGDRKQASMSNENGIAGELESEGSILEEHDVRVDENTSLFNKTDLLKMDNGEAETKHTKEKIGESIDDTSSIGRKREKLKQKKLPLSICNFRDQANPKEEPKSRSILLAEENISKTSAGNKPLFSVGCSRNGIISVEKISVRKCQTFKAPPACVKQNKVMQS